MMNGTEKLHTKEEALGRIAARVYRGQMLTQAKIDKIEKLMRDHWNELSLMAHVIHNAHEHERKRQR